MITLDQILAEYPENLRIFRESILKEYLQYKILNSIFNSQYSDKLAFLGGMALRIIYGSTRFSEDLDFDNFNLKEEEFKDLGEIIQKDLRLEGLESEINTVTKNAYRIKIRIPKLLFEHKILIQVDTVPQNFEELAGDVEPLLFDPRDKKRVLLFREFLRQNAIPTL